MGESGWIHDSIGYHRIKTKGRAITLHVYSPAKYFCDVYDE